MKKILLLLLILLVGAMANSAVPSTYKYIWWYDYSSHGTMSEADGIAACTTIGFVLDSDATHVECSITELLSYHLQYSINACDTGLCSTLNYISPIGIFRLADDMLVVYIDEPDVDESLGAAAVAFFTAPPTTAGQGFEQWIGERHINLMVDDKFGGGIYDSANLDMYMPDYPTASIIQTFGYETFIGPTSKAVEFTDPIGAPDPVGASLVVGGTDTNPAIVNVELDGGTELGTYATAWNAWDIYGTGVEADTIQKDAMTTINAYAQAAKYVGFFAVALYP